MKTIFTICLVFSMFIFISGCNESTKVSAEKPGLLEGIFDFITSPFADDYTGPTRVSSSDEIQRATAVGSEKGRDQTFRDGAYVGIEVPVD